MLMYFLALIPARGGSKGIPKKNLIDLCGRPLIDYTIDAVQSSNSVSDVIVSTDDNEIADHCRQRGVRVPFIRPNRLSADDTGAKSVMRHAVEKLEELDGQSIDAIVYLQPTSPLRTATHIDEAVEIYMKGAVDAVVSALRVPHQYSPESLMCLKGNRLSPRTEKCADLLQRQDKPEYFARNGPSVLVCSRDVVFDDAPFYDPKNNVHAYIMNKLESIDIDDAEDLALAESIIELNRSARRVSSLGKQA